jgi:NADH:ubiquinone oxidoreductase subunit
MIWELNVQVIRFNDRKSGMANPILQFMTWWHDCTIGTALHTWRRGIKVGTDDQGNRYYRHSRADRRWVIYKGEVEASRVPPDWHAWLHGLSDQPPSEVPLPSRPWEKPHIANPTGTSGRYLPPGSLAKGGKRPPATGDYEPWRP